MTSFDNITSLNPELARKFEMLRQLFLKGLPDRLQALENSIDPQVCEKLFHQLAGVAGGYGFDELGQLARRAEHSCQQQLPQWLDLKQELEAAIRHTLAKAGSAA